MDGGTFLPDTSWMMAAQDPLHRKLVMRPAEPLTDHIKACLAFLTRISRVEITGGSKKQLEITVHLNASVDDPDSQAASFTIARSMKEFETIQKAIHDHARLHPDLDLKKYDLLPCALCNQFKTMEPVAPGGLFTSTESVRTAVLERLQFLLKGALVAPSNPEMHCEGLVCIPSGLTKFLLRGVDQTKL